ncbi:MAG TPA: hypothetical protein PLY87_00985 [Planctomycetaceae bacterium]|nr:hypothetical protein [Planctomycetaceae bacterium]
MGRTARKQRLQRAKKTESTPLKELQAELRPQIDKAIAALDPLQLDSIINRIVTKAPDGCELARGVELRTSMLTYAERSIREYFNFSWEHHAVDLMHRVNQVWENARPSIRGIAATNFVNVNLEHIYTPSRLDSRSIQIRNQCISFWVEQLLAKGHQLHDSAVMYPWSVALEDMIQRIPSCFESDDVEIAIELRTIALELLGRRIRRAVDECNGWSEIARSRLFRDTVRTELRNHVDVEEAFDFEQAVATLVDKRKHFR